MQVEIKQLQRELGLTVVYVTHDQEEALAMSDRLAIMRDGEIVQVGTGRELYEEPANAFVAQFLGETNLVPGRVLGDAGAGETRVEHGSGFVTTARSASWASAGSDVTLSIRPEHVDVAPAGDERPLDGNECPGTVESAIYLGDSVKYRIALAGRVMTAKVTNRSGTPSLEAGQRVRVAWAPRHAVLVR
jgi:putative spermidine/putrescine transport system ATP-binding protein